MSHLLRCLPYSRQLAGADVPGPYAGADAIGLEPAPTTPPGGPPEAVTVPPPNAPAAIRAMAGEVFRRAVWAAGGAPAWDDSARQAWARIQGIPAMRSYADAPGEVTSVVDAWLRRAVTEVPIAWAAEPRGPAAVTALQEYARAVLAQLDTWNPVTLYQTGTAWREQAVRDGAAGMYRQAAAVAEQVKETIEDASPDFGFGAAIGLGVLAVVAVAVAAPELAGATAKRAVTGVQRGFSKR